MEYESDERSNDINTGISMHSYAGSCIKKDRAAGWKELQIFLYIYKLPLS
jgi:hypothetical protein